MFITCAFYFSYVCVHGLSPFVTGHEARSFIVLVSLIIADLAVIGAHLRISLATLFFR